MAQSLSILNLYLGAAPRDGRHPGRLAVEQLYGYMVRNGIVYGILTTFKGWSFFRRQDGGVLFMTRMYGYAPQSIAEGFRYPLNGFTIMLALYYISQVAEATPDVPESTQGQPGTIFLPTADDSSDAAAPCIQIHP